MKVRVEREDGSVEKIELSVGDLRVLQLGDLNCLAGAGMTHSFTADPAAILNRGVPCG